MFTSLMHRVAPEHCSGVREHCSVFSVLFRALNVFRSERAFVSERVRHYVRVRGRSCSCSAGLGPFVFVFVFVQLGSAVFVFVFMFGAWSWVVFVFVFVFVFRTVLRSRPKARSTSYKQMC